MKIATVQLATELGRFQRNVQEADRHLSTLNPGDVDLLVLPELAFTGYNFTCLSHIWTHLEATAAGPTSIWARQTAARLDCIVIVGYPEITDEVEPKRYNSTVMIAPNGEVLGNYRKTFLFCTDETWAMEGPGFWAGTLPLPPPLDPVEDEFEVRVAHGICMDINNYQFLGPWEAFEFANHCLRSDAQLIVMCNAWLEPPPAGDTSLPNGENPRGNEPNMQTMVYWADRLLPLVNDDEKRVVVFADRVGVEGTTKYAGTSTVLRVGGGEVKVWDALSRGLPGLLTVNTDEEPRWTLS